MAMARFTCCCALALALAGVPACSDDSPSSTPEQDLPTNVSVQVGQKGGTLKAKGMTLEIPEGALDKNVKVSISNAGQSAPKDVRAKQLSDVYEFGPSGTTFTKEVKITFEAESEDERAEVYFTKEDGSGFERIDSNKNGRQVSALVKHFSQGFVGVPLDDDDAGMDAGTALDAGKADADPELDAQQPGDDAYVDQPPDAGTIDAGSDDDASGADAGPSSDADTTPMDGGADAGQPADAGFDASVEAGPPPTVHIMVQSRDPFGVLVNQTWAAFQDGNGSWLPLFPSSAGVYEFDVASSTYAVALVCSSPDQVNSWGSVNYGTVDLQAVNVVTQAPPCTAGKAPTAYTVQGTLNLGSDQYWRYGTLHESSAIALSGGPVDYTVGQFLAGEQNDLFFASGSSAAPDAISRLLVQRNLSPKANVTGLNLDMVKNGTAALGTAQAVVTSASDATSIDVYYTTRGPHGGLWLNAAATAGSSTRAVSFTTLPESIRVANDRYFLVAADDQGSQWRKASLATYTTGALNLDLPAPFPVSFASLSSPYLRPSFDFTPVAGANLYTFGISYSPVRTSLHQFAIEVTPAWVSSSGGSLTFPDWADVPGFDASWVAPSGASASVKAAVLDKSTNAGVDSTSESGQSSSVGLAL
jgi:hypothetical protein